MRSLTQYINEALRGEIRKWFKQVYDTMKKLIKDNKLEPIEVDVDKLSKPDKGGFKFDDFATDNIIKDILKNQSLGFTVINQMIKIPTKYMINNDEEKTQLKPECLPYWYVESGEKKDDQKVYFVGLIMFDTTTKYVEDFCNIMALETSLCVTNSTDVQKAMLNDFALHYLNKKGNYKGLATKPLHPKMKAIFTKLGFRSFKDNKDILTYKI